MSNIGVVGNDDVMRVGKVKEMYHSVTRLENLKRLDDVNYFVSEISRLEFG